MLLEVAPQFDDVTAYSFRWSQRLYEELGERHVSCLRENAVRNIFEDYMKEYDPELITFFDHGDSQGLLQQGGVGYVIDKRNASLLKGREIYTMACTWGSDGGADAYRKGARAVWAYTKVFAFVTTDEEIFCRLANMGLILRRQDHLSWEQCVSLVKSAYDEEIEKGGNPWTIISLINDRDALVCWTDANPPPSDCLGRNLGIRLLGTAGQKLSRTCALATVSFYASWGYGVYALWETATPKTEGLYAAFALMFLLPLVVLREHVRWLKS